MGLNSVALLISLSLMMFFNEVESEIVSLTPETFDNLQNQGRSVLLYLYHAKQYLKPVEMEVLEESLEFLEKIEVVVGELSCGKYREFQHCTHLTVSSFLGYFRYVVVRKQYHNLSRAFFHF